MPFVECVSCGTVFAAEPSRFYWCACGEPLSDGDEIREPAPPLDHFRGTGRFRPAEAKSVGEVS
jgi:hypothetical protein